MMRKPSAAASLSSGSSLSGPLPSSLPFENRRQALSYSDAERRDAARGAGASHLVDQRRCQAGPAATERVTNRNRTAVDVQFCVVDAQFALAGAGLRGERLVQLEQVDAVHYLGASSYAKASAGQEMRSTHRIHSGLRNAECG